MDDFLAIIVILVIGYLILVISAIVKFFQMANDVREIKNHLQNRSVSVWIKDQKESDNSETDFFDSEKPNYSNDFSNTSSIAEIGITGFKLDDGRRIDIRTSVLKTPNIGDEVLMVNNSKFSGELKVSLGLKSWMLQVNENEITLVLAKKEAELNSGLKVYYFSHSDSSINEGDCVYLNNGEPLADGEYHLAEHLGGDKFVIKNQIVVKEIDDKKVTLIVIGVLVLILIIIFSIDY